MRLWAGQQKKGVVVSGKWKGAEPLWNIGIAIRSEEVERGLRVSEVAKVIKDTLKKEFPSYNLQISPKAKGVLAGRYNGFNSFPHSSSQGGVCNIGKPERVIEVQDHQFHK